MTPFTIELSDDILSDLKERLARTRFPDEFSNENWGYGANAAYIRELCTYWHDTYDWRKHEAALNVFDQYLTDVNGLNLHYLHVRSPEENALPLIITHGWPGSVYEFHKIIGPLTDPAAHGGDPADAFHVVCPSMPGYGFSEAPKEPGFDIKRVAETNIALMAKLGYTRYGAQGGDWGSLATAWSGKLDPEHVAGIHMNMTLGRRPKDRDSMEGVTPEEAMELARIKETLPNETGYQAIQGTKPQTLGYGLNDSPAGLAAWIVEKFHTWSDCGGDIESRFTKDELLTNIMLYWATEKITSSVRLYCESSRSNRFFNPEDGMVEVPSGFSVFPTEIANLPRAWVEDSFNVTHWSLMPSGGHFAALEEPQLLVEDMRTFFRTVR